MSSRSLQFAALLQLVVLLLAGGLGEALHALPGAAHDGHGCGGHGCCHHGDHPHEHACHDHAEHACVATAEEEALQVAEGEQAADDGECSICRQLRAWRQVAVGQVIIEAPLVGIETIPTPANRSSLARTIVALQSRGPPAIL